MEKNAKIKELMGGNFQERRRRLLFDGKSRGRVTWSQPRGVPAPREEPPFFRVDGLAKVADEPDAERTAPALWPHEVIEEK